MHPSTIILRAKVVLTAMALAAAATLVVVASWPLKALVVLAFVRGLFVTDVMAFRNAARRRSSERSPSTASRGARRGAELHPALHQVT